MPYKVTDYDIDVVDEFMNKPVGHHSGDLQRVLNTFRSAGMENKFCIVVVEPFKRWQLAMTSGVRGAPLKRLDVYFDDLMEAERYVFRERWREHTGTRLNR